MRALIWLIAWLLAACLPGAGTEPEQWLIKTEMMDGTDAIHITESATNMDLMEESEELSYHGDYGSPPRSKKKKKKKNRKKNRRKKNKSRRRKKKKKKKKRRRSRKKKKKKNKKKNASVSKKKDCSNSDVKVTMKDDPFCKNPENKCRCMKASVRLKEVATIPLKVVTTKKPRRHRMTAHRSEGLCMQKVCASKKEKDVLTALMPSGNTKMNYTSYMATMRANMGLPPLKPKPEPKSTEQKSQTEPAVADVETNPETEVKPTITEMQSTLEPAETTVATEQEPAQENLEPIQDPEVTVWTTIKVPEIRGEKYVETTTEFSAANLEAKPTPKFRSRALVKNQIEMKPDLNPKNKPKPKQKAKPKWKQRRSKSRSRKQRQRKKRRKG